MFDPATLNRAAHILRMVSPDLPADAALRQELAANRTLSAAARSAVSRAIFAYYRWLSWLDLEQTLQRQVADAWERQRRFEKDPSSVKPEALAARAVPAWLAGEVTLPPETLRQFQNETALWIRARPGQAESLARELGDCSPPTPNPPTPELPADKEALRYGGVRDLFLTAAFKRGAFEIQDLASQFVGLACNPKPGETWWDACAGEGGKTLHLADQMANMGVIWASDRSARRLDQLKRRFARAQLFNVRIAPWDGSAKPPTRTKFDGILVDAPCSGVGTWQRNPHARWTTTPVDVAELAAVQTRLLTHVSASLKPGGRLVYAVCTLTRSETSAVADAFTAAHPEFEPMDVFDIPVQSGKKNVFIWPHEAKANGMFIASWMRR